MLAPTKFHPLEYSGTQLVLSRSLSKQASLKGGVRHETPLQMKAPLTALYPCMHTQCCLLIIPNYARSAELPSIPETMPTYQAHSPYLTQMFSGHYHIALNFRRSLISRIFNHLRKYFNENFPGVQCVRVAISRNYFNEIFKNRYSQKFIPQRFSAIWYICKIVHISQGRRKDF